MFRIWLRCSFPLALAALSVIGCDDGTSGPTTETGVIEAPLTIQAPGYRCKGKNAIVCNDNNLCTVDTCDRKLGCVYTNLANGTACDDNDLCTSTSSCSAGTCTGGTATVCNDDNPCTDNTCVAGTGCVFQNNTATCDDENACTEGDACSAGFCVGTPKDCSDGDTCTSDVCTGGICSNTAFHDVCEAGGPLGLGCNACIDAVCTDDPYCCNTQWDSICVGEVTEFCSTSCPAAAQAK